MRTRIQKISKYAPSIFQGRFSFAAQRTTFSFTAQHPLERSVFRMLMGVLLVLACAYVYFVGATILNVIAKKDALAQTAALATAVSTLEREYFSLSQKVGPEDGIRLGLSPVSDTAYVHRPGNAAAATIERNDI